jgi:hypothetical protein
LTEACPAFWEQFVAFSWLHGGDEGFGMPSSVWDGAFLDDAHPMLDLTERLFDRIDDSANPKRHYS